MKDNGTESESRQSSIFHISRPLNGEQLSTATFKASCGKDRILLELSRFFGFKTTSVVFMLLKLTFVKDNHFTLFNCLFVWYDSRRKLVAPPDRFIYLRQREFGAIQSFSPIHPSIYAFQVKHKTGRASLSLSFSLKCKKIGGSLQQKRLQLKMY